MDEPGVAAAQHYEMLTEEGMRLPSFCGGAKSSSDTLGDDAQMDDMDEGPEKPVAQSTMDYVLQNLHCRLGNPQNRCYANAPFRLWAWAGSFLSGSKMWNKTAAAVTAALADDEIVHLPQLQSLHTLWEKFDDTKQDDAAHFLLELKDLAQPSNVILQYHHVDHRQRVHQRREFPTHLIFEDLGRPQEFEELINQWANQAEGQILDGNGLWVAQIGRYVRHQQEWTKRHQVLNVPSIFNLPITLDGNQTRTERYSLLGLLCHSGTAHKSGHFYAVFAYRGLYWIVDDGTYPRPVPGLQDSLRAQIVQVWAAPSKFLLPDDIPSDLAMAPEQSSITEPEHKRRCMSGVSFAFANVTNLGQAVRQWLSSRERTPIFLAETHLSPEDHEKTAQWFNTRSFGVLGQPAAISPKGGTNGGLMLVYPAHLHFHYIQKQIIDGCGWFAVHWTFENFDLILVMVYFKCGEGVQGATNSILWSGLLTFVTSVSKPVIIMGDFNITPEEFMVTTMSTIMQVQVLASGEDTCHTGRELDWALVTKALQPEVQISVDWQVPFKPHAQLIFRLNKDLQHVAVTQIQRFQPAPKLEKISAEWMQIEDREVSVKWLDMPTNELTQQAGRLYHKIERYVLQQIETPTLGRGTSLSYVQKPLADASKPWLWKKGTLAFWSQVEIRLQQHMHRAHKQEAIMQHLERLGWHIEAHWHSDAQMTLDGFKLLYQMLWRNHDNEHVQVLLQAVKQQWSLQQQTVFDQEAQEYRTWLNAASLKGCRGLFRALKKDELPYVRPFQDLPRQERMEKRIQQWGEIWHIREKALETKTMQALIYKGQEMAKELKPLQVHHVWNTIKKLSHKAPGLDATGYDFFRELPYQAVPELIRFFHEIEAKAQIPNQWTTALIALLPKNKDIERPIALVASLYRLWCKVRSPYTKQWSLDIQETYKWERAVPGTECLKVALKRAFVTEHHQALKRTVISVLMDMSNFYDRIDLEKLNERWLDSDYPATHAALAMQIYCGSRILEAEGEAARPIWASHGILAGDPQAPLAAKIYLKEALHAFCKRYPQLQVDLWIDDLSFDIVDRDPANAVRIAIAAFQYIKSLLEADNLVISAKKTGFIASNSQAKRLLQEQLPDNGPTVHDTMRDLGVDCTAGRLRRIATMKQRRYKTQKKMKKLQALKIPQRAIRLRLYKGSIMASISWGHEAMGLAPQVRKKMRATLGRQLGHQRTGNLDIVFDMRKGHQDPDYAAFYDQIHIFKHFAGQWPEALRRDLNRSWEHQQDRLAQATHPWQVTRGPMAALQCYLQEKGWQIQNLQRWTKEARNGEPEFKIDLFDTWPTIKAELKRAENSDRLARISSRSMLQEVQTTLDWVPWKKMSRTLSQHNACALQTWHQGALFTKTSESTEGQHLQCPHCAQAATPVHLLWMCKETRQHFPALTPEDQFELEHGLNLEFWAQGLVMMPKLNVATGGASVQAWGTWTTQDEAQIPPQDVVSIGIASASTDTRLKRYAVSIVHHTQIGGQLYRQGAVVAILPGRQSWERAWYYGLRMIGHYVSLHQRIVVHVQSSRAWEAWQQNKHTEVFYDLTCLIPWDQKQRIRVLCIGAKQLKETPNNEWSLRNRMADAAKAAREVALSLQPLEQEKELKEQDKKYQRIAPQAIERIKHLLSDKQHFLHAAKETGKQKREDAREAKRVAFLQLTHNTQPGQHTWVVKGKGVQCSSCKRRLTMHNKYQDILDGQTAMCDDNPGMSLVGGAASDQTKAALLQQIVQGALPNMAPHIFAIQTNYISCEKCNIKLLKNSAREKLLEMTTKPCWDEQWSPTEGWKGHASHVMWRKGGKLWCTSCGAHAAKGFAASKGLQRPCSHQTGQATLPACFRPKVGTEGAD